MTQEDIARNFLPIIRDDKTYKSSAIDVMMASKLSVDELIKVHAVEQTIALLKGNSVSVKVFDEVYTTIYNKLKQDNESNN